MKEKTKRGHLLTDEHIPLSEAARSYSLDYNRLFRAVANGSLRATRKEDTKGRSTGRSPQLYVKRSDLRAWIRARSNSSRPLRAKAPDWTTGFYTRAGHQDNVTPPDSPIWERLAFLTKKGNPYARDYLTYMLAGGARAIANKYRLSALEIGYSQNDLAQEVLTRMLYSTQDYDPDKGRFFPFAYRRGEWIAWRVLEQGYLIHVPIALGRLVRSKRKGYDNQYDKHYSHTPELLEAALNVFFVEDFEDVVEVIQQEAEPSYEEEDIEKLIDRIDYEALRDDTPIPERDKYMTEKNVGYDHTLGNIGEEFGISRERVRQLKEQALDAYRIHHGKMSRRRGI